MNITITKDEAQFDLYAAWQIIAQIINKPNSVIGLSTGRTTHNLHRLVADIYRQYPFNVSQVTFFGLDEVIHVPQDYFGACHHMLRTEIINDLHIDQRNFLMLPTMSDDFERDCRSFDQELANRGGIDLLVLGLGENGHLGFNQPGTPFGSCTRLAQMNNELETRIRKETNTPASVVLGGITLGMKDIMHSRHILNVAKGDNKACIVKQILEGPVTEQVPGSVLQLHSNCDYLLDNNASKLLSIHGSEE